MKWTLKLGQLAGIDVYAHLTFVLLLLVIALLALPAGFGAAVTGVLFILLMFGCVLLHELGHALAARRYGIRTHDIILLPMGGVARMERMPEDPRQEIVVALAGPAVNVAIAAGLFLLGALLGTGLFEQLLWVNLMLVGFNLIPAFPMDGGRVLRALVALRRPHSEATELAAQVGKSFAVLFGLAALLTGNLVLGLVAVFVFFGAGAEAKAGRVRLPSTWDRAADAALSDFRCVGAEQTLARAVDVVLAGSQREFPVLSHDGRLVGLLTESDLMTGVARLGPHAHVWEIMRRNVPVGDPNELLSSAAERLRASGVQSMPLVRGERLVGLLTLENVARFRMFRSRAGRFAFLRMRS